MAESKLFQSPSLRGVARDADRNRPYSPPRAFQSPSLRGVARDAQSRVGGQVLLEFQSPSLRGVARDWTAKWPSRMLAAKVSVPFSSGCRARPTPRWPVSCRTPVSVPFSSGCRARREMPQQFEDANRHVSVPFSSGCRARHLAKFEFPVCVDGFSPLLFGVSRATLPAERLFLGLPRFSPLLFGVSRATSEFSPSSTTAA